MDIVTNLQSVLNCMQNKYVEISFTDGTNIHTVNGRFASYNINVPASMMVLYIVLTHENWDIMNCFTMDSADNTDIFVRSKNTVEIIVEDFDKKIYKTLSNNCLEIISDKYPNITVSIKLMNK